MKKLFGITLLLFILSLNTYADKNGLIFTGQRIPLPNQPGKFYCDTQAGVCYRCTYCHIKEIIIIELPDPATGAMENYLQKTIALEETPSTPESTEIVFVKLGRGRP